MADWPISISEAARRLRLPYRDACVIVRSHRIPTHPMIYNGKGLMPDGFEMFRRAAEPCVREPAPANA